MVSYLCRRKNLILILTSKNKRKNEFRTIQSNAKRKRHLLAALNPGQLKDMQFADRQEKWGYILANIGRMELQDLSQEDDVFRSVFEDSMHQKKTNMEKEEYDLDK